MSRNLSGYFFKKAYIPLIILAALTACKRKTNEQAPSNSTTVQYNYVANVSDTYVGNYTNANGLIVDTVFTGTTFSKTFTTDQSRQFTDAYFSLYTLDKSLQIKGTVSILINKNMKLQQDVTIDSLVTGFSVSVMVFK
ncbi:MAG: hypothetical protein ACXVB0_03285 [Mucilaginibacter sp.]